MNKVIFMGRLTKDPEIRYGGANNTAVAKFNLAVDRKVKKEGEPSADFFSIVAFGHLGEFCEKYLKKGTKICMIGRIENNNYKNKDGDMVYSFQAIAEVIEFAESKKAAEEHNEEPPTAPKDVFMDIPDDLADELPFN